jgi:hypothetical protein
LSLPNITTIVKSIVMKNLIHLFKILRSICFTCCSLLWFLFYYYYHYFIIFIIIIYILTIIIIIICYYYYCIFFILIFSIISIYIEIFILFPLQHLKIPALFVLVDSEYFIFCVTNLFTINFTKKLLSPFILIFR